MLVFSLGNVHIAKEYPPVFSLVGFAFYQYCILDFIKTGFGIYQDGFFFWPFDTVLYPYVLFGQSFLHAVAFHWQVLFLGIYL